MVSESCADGVRETRPSARATPGCSSPAPVTTSSVGSSVPTSGAPSGPGERGERVARDDRVLLVVRRVGDRRAHAQDPRHRSDGLAERGRADGEPGEQLPAGVAGPRLTALHQRLAEQPRGDRVEPGEAVHGHVRRQGGPGLGEVERDRRRRDADRLAMSRSLSPVCTWYVPTVVPAGTRPATSSAAMPTDPGSVAKTAGQRRERVSRARRVEHRALVEREVRGERAAGSHARRTAPARPRD